MTANSKGNVLVLSTYPIVEPRHGGQVRVLNIKRAYEAAGWSVTSIAVYQTEAYPALQAGPHDIPFPEDSPYRLFKGRRVPLIDDLLSGTFAAASDGGFDRALSSAPAPIDVVQVEQPWLWPLAVKMRQRPEFRASLFVYSSHNIEAPLKSGILKQYEIDAVHQVVEAVDALERQAAREADLTVAVTADEATVLRNWGAKRVIVARNGIEPWIAEDDDLLSWRERLPRSPWLLYIASAHPPNFSHFAQIFADSLACFPPTSRLVVAGSVGEHIYRVASTTRWSNLNHSRLQLLCELSDQDLAAVKSLAHGFVLPIPFGGGTNIKTAEALYSGKYVVGTPAAFRGYEAYLELPEVRVAVDSKSFHAAIRDIVRLPPTAALPGTAGFERRQQLRWDKSLERIAQTIGELDYERNARG